MTLRQAQGDRVRVTAPLMIWQGEAHGGIGYVVIAGEAAEAIRDHELMRRLELGKRRGFGSVKVTVRVGGSEWRTSVFPQKSGGYILPVKADVRRRAKIGAGDEVDLTLEIVEV